MKHFDNINPYSFKYFHLYSSIENTTYWSIIVVLGKAIEKYIQINFDILKKNTTESTTKN